ncbi:MAG TPA: type II toxin-antitoxin system RelE/ParE family toxin [Candidatus Polarisedimenticolia bacterium]|nr:type II toxin-antitoxin system RelE/ParE family toxin [Candidatus Polarisedimenticolia bacterium]
MTEARHRVELAPAAQRQLRKLPPGDAARLRGPILSLGIEPRTPGASKVASSAYWRLRVGDLRIVYAIDSRTRLVVVLRIARRAESTYRRVG